MSTSVLKALPGKLDIKRHSPSALFVLSNVCLRGNKGPGEISQNESVQFTANLKKCILIFGYFLFEHKSLL